jgi:hypothetical protein
MKGGDGTAVRVLLVTGMCWERRNTKGEDDGGRPGRSPSTWKTAEPTTMLPITGPLCTCGPAA